MSRFIPLVTAVALLGIMMVEAGFNGYRFCIWIANLMRVKEEFKFELKIWLQGGVQTVGENRVCSWLIYRLVYNEALLLPVLRSPTGVTVFS